MSYDLMVFETGAAPKEHKGFIEWYFRQTKWSEGHSYNDPGVASARLQAWFSDMILAFPPLNGPLAKEELPDDEEPLRLQHRKAVHLYRFRLVEGRGCLSGSGESGRETPARFLRCEFVGRGSLAARKVEPYPRT